METHGIVLPGTDLRRLGTAAVSGVLVTDGANTVDLRSADGSSVTVVLVDTDERRSIDCPDIVDLDGTLVLGSAVAAL